MAKNEVTTIIIRWDKYHNDILIFRDGGKHTYKYSEKNIDRLSPFLPEIYSNSYFYGGMEFDIRDEKRRKSLSRQQKMLVYWGEHYFIEMIVGGFTPVQFCTIYNMFLIKYGVGPDFIQDGKDIRFEFQGE